MATLLQSGITFSNNHYAAIVDVSSKSATITVDRSLAYKDNIQIQVGDKGEFERLIDGNEYQVRLGETDLGRIETGATHHTSAASILLFDSRGHVIWQAP